MAFDAHRNFAVSTVATPPSPAASGTSLVLASGEGARFPSGAAAYNAVVCPASASPTPANAEVVRVTNRATDTLTIQRAQEGSVARSVIAGDRIFMALTAKVLTDVETQLAPLPTEGTQAARLAATPSAGLLWRETDTGLLYRGDGAAWQMFTATGFVRKTAPETINNQSTVQADDHLKWPVRSGEVWFCEAFLRLQAASATPDWKVRLAQTGAVLHHGVHSVAGDGLGSLHGVPVASSPSAQVGGGAAIAFGSRAGVHQVVYYVLAAFTGNLTATLEWAQNTAAPEDSTVLENSFLRLQRLA